MPDFEFIKFTRKGGRADLVLDRPPENCFIVEMVEEIVNALDQIREDETLKVLVVRGAGGNFCGGIETQERTTEKVGLLMPQVTRMFSLLNSICGITISAVEGQAKDAGFELAAFCDIVFASRSALFSHPEINLGVFPPISSAILPRLVGRNKALDWIISGRVLTAEEVFNSGLVNYLTLDGELVDSVNSYADRIASLSAPAVIWTKRAIDRSLYSPAMDSLRASESTYMIELMNNLDPHEGLKAAIEGRPPKWRNK